jgi:hypothetical protein
MYGPKGAVSFSFKVPFTSPAENPTPANMAVTIITEAVSRKPMSNPTAPSSFTSPMPKEGFPEIF